MSYQKMKVTLKGETPLMFDRFVTMEKKKIRPEQKLYLKKEKGKNYLIFPFLNLISFLASKTTTSCCKKFLDKRKYKDSLDVVQSCFGIEENTIYILDKKGEKIEIGEFKSNDNGEIIDEKSGMYIRYDVARLKNAVNPKERPVLNEWRIDFTCLLEDNDLVTLDDLMNFFEQGGKYIGLGTFRPMFGKFSTQFEII